MYKLYYIRGINRLDTPYFSTLQEQATYFESKKILEIDYIYPPHYRDTLDFDITDLDMKTQANYLSINFNNKTYYYFIDNVVYINEEMIQISITMDVIQTYMFDIDYIHCDIARRTIDRWNDDGTINRNYLRENLSNGDMIFNKHNIDNITPFGFYIIRFSFNQYYAIGSEKTPTILSNVLGSRHTFYNHTIQQKFFNRNNEVITDSRIAIIPFTQDSNYTVTFKDFTNEYLGVTSKDTVTEIGKMENVYSIRYVPFSLFEDLTYTIDETNKVIKIESTSDHYRCYKQCIKEIAKGEFKSYEYVNYIELSSLIKLNELSNGFDFDFTKNTLIQEPFDTQFVPALFDENYIQYQYGEKISLTGAPLYQMKESSLYSKTIVDIVTGYRLHYITDSLISNSDNYRTLIYVTTDESMALYNDAWNTYLSQNQATLTRGVRLNHLKNIYNVIPNVAKNISTGNVGGTIANISDTLSNAYEIEKKLQITKENLEFTPDTLKLGNAINCDIISDSIVPCYYLYEVNDIDKVAEQYEAYGYKVNEHYSKVNILEVLNTRYYYNVIKCEDMEINLKVLNDELTITRIKDRFNGGLRLWNIKNLDSNMQMGDLFVYDNVEKKYLE